jgi:hypothetical protein
MAQRFAGINSTANTLYTCMRKVRNLLFAISTWLFFSGCNPMVSFNEPQPANTKSLNEFPEKLQGEFLNNAGNPLLKISSRFILRVYDYDRKVHKSNLDSTNKITGDTLLDLTDGRKYFVLFEGDSIVIHHHDEDTLFYISNQNVLKKFRGYYFLNFGDSNVWYVKKLNLNKGILEMKSIETENEIKVLREITDTESDTTSYYFKPTGKQFRKFIKQDGFKTAEYFVRLKT